MPVAARRRGRPRVDLRRRRTGDRAVRRGRYCVERLDRLLCSGLVTAIAAGLPILLNRYRDTDAEALSISRAPRSPSPRASCSERSLIGLAAVMGLPHWQSIPSTWDAVWHANTVRWILETGQASPTHMGELRNVETHDALYYPSTFHAVASVFSQLTGAAPATAYTLNSLAAAVWLFPASAAILSWKLLRPVTGQWQAAGAAATAAMFSASFTAIPYVEFDTASMPNLAAYGVAVPAMALVDVDGPDTATASRLRSSRCSACSPCTSPAAW